VNEDPTDRALLSGVIQRSGPQVFIDARVTLKFREHLGVTVR
jgi:hypothetical protein